MSVSGSPLWAMVAARGFLVAEGQKKERRKNRWPSPEQAQRRIVRNGPVSFRSKTQPEEHGPATWDQFPIYDLEKAALEIFLIQTFGGRHSFMITEKSDYYRFLVPRSLTESEKLVLDEQRFASSAIDTGSRAQQPLQRVSNQPSASVSHDEPAASSNAPPLDHDDSPEREETATLSFQCRNCMVIYLLWLLVVAASLAVGFWRSFVTNDEGKGFTEAAYIVAVGGIIVRPIQNRHNQRAGHG